QSPGITREAVGDGTEIGADIGINNSNAFRARGRIALADVGLRGPAPVGNNSRLPLELAGFYGGGVGKSRKGRARGAHSTPRFLSEAPHVPPPLKGEGWGGVVAALLPFDTTPSCPPPFRGR